MKKNTGFKRIVLAGTYAVAGWRAAARHEAAFRQELMVAVPLIALVFLLELSSLERALLVAVTVLVLVVELVNSAVEATIDRIGPDFHELSGRAKDLGSGAVLLSLLLACYVWGELVLVDALGALVGRG